MPRTGRPPSEDPRDQHERFRTTKSEHELLLAAADKAGQPLGVWLRERCVAAAKRAR